MYAFYHIDLFNLIWRELIFECLHVQSFDLREIRGSEIKLQAERIDSLDFSRSSG